MHNNICWNKMRFKIVKCDPLQIHSEIHWNDDKYCCERV